MGDNRLSIVAVENRSETAKRTQSSMRHKRKEEIQAKFERMWLLDPLQFDPLRNCMERERLERTWRLVTEFLDPVNKLIADLGCGGGVFSKRFCDHGAKVHAVDVAGNALQCVKQLKLENIETYQECLPKTLLKDEGYDLVVSTEVIAYLQADEYRLYFSELSRLLKPEGYVICSTAIDFNSEDALQRFADLAETEFKIEKWILSYHALYLRICNFFDAPAHFIRANQDNEYSQQVVNKTKFGRWWFRLNSSSCLSIFWRGVNFFFQPIASLLKQNRTLLLKMEKMCKFFSDPTGISHVMFIGIRRPLVETPPPGMEPIETKLKKTVWE